jgi:hypothetical protein
MSDQTVTPIRRRATPKAPQLLLTELPEETVHRVACVLKYLSNHPRASDAAQADDDERFGGFILLRDLAAALDYSQEVAP